MEGSKCEKIENNERMRVNSREMRAVNENMNENQSERAINEKQRS